MRNFLPAWRARNRPSSSVEVAPVRELHGRALEVSPAPLPPTATSPRSWWPTACWRQRRNPGLPLQWDGKTISELKKAAESGDADARKAWKLVNKGEYKK